MKSKILSVIFSFGALGVTLFLGFIAIVLNANTLGPDTFGKFILLVTFSTIAAQIIGLGYSDVVMLHGIRDPSFIAAHAATAVFLSILSAVFVAPVLFFIAGYAVERFSYYIFLIIISESLGQRLITIAEHTAIADRRTRTADAIRVTSSAIKLLPATIVLFSGTVSVFEVFCVLYFCVTMSGAIGSLLCVKVDIMHPARLTTNNMRTAMSFMGSGFSRFSAQSADRIAIAYAAISADISGVYLLGSRIYQIVTSLIQSLQKHFVISFYGSDIGKLHKKRVQIFSSSLFAGSIIAIGVYFFSRYISYFFTDQYDGAVLIMERFSFVIPFYIVYATGLPLLAALGRFTIRLSFSTLELILNTCLCLYALKYHSIEDIPLALAMSYATLSILMMIFLSLSNKHKAAI